MSWYLYRMELGIVVAVCRCDGGRGRPAHMRDKTGKRELMSSGQKTEKEKLIGKFGHL